MNDDTTLIDILYHRAQQEAERLVFCYLADGEQEEERVTFGQFAQRVQVIGAFLQEHGMMGRRALLIYHAGVDYVAAFFGCLYAGVVPIPMYPPRANQRFGRIQSIMADADTSLALTNAAILQSLQQTMVQDAAFRRLVWVTTDDLRDVSAGVWVPTVSERLAFLQYTSGSTSQPKGVMVTHGNLLHNLALFCGQVGVSSETRPASWLPQYHDMGMIGIVLTAVYAGLPTVLMSPTSFLQRPIRWLEVIGRYGITHTGGPNFGYDLCVRKVTPEQLATLDLRSWEVAFSGSEPVRCETLDRFAAVFAPCGFQARRFFVAYGLAEATLVVSGGGKGVGPRYLTVSAAGLQAHRVVPVAVDAPDAQTLVGCGFGASDQEVAIVDPERCVRCAGGEVGEIWVAGPSVTDGYWNRAEETGRVFGARVAGTGEGPFLRTGDLGFLYEGELFVTGRLKDLIIIAGRNQYPQDIEQCVEGCHPALRLAGGAAFSVEVEGEERLVIVHEVERHYHKWRLADVVGAMRAAVAEQYELHVYAVVLIRPGRIPKTSSGKIQRSLCRAKYVAGELDVLEVS